MFENPFKVVKLVHLLPLCSVLPKQSAEKGFRYATPVAQVHVHFDSCQAVLLQKLHGRAKVHCCKTSKVLRLWGI